jgi:hypothetical protein
MVIERGDTGKMIKQLTLSIRWDRSCWKGRGVETYNDQKAK